ncbi:hypothetical protein [Ralstonia mannitolilytica]|uniref:hypothetical protein n=1 Tax=Ralstonia mannitolilytica TaxID=105219 RepID=UPI003749C9A8
MSFDIFAAIARSSSSTIAVHNVRLIDVQPAEDGLERLTIEYGGTTREVLGGGRFSEEWSRREVGKFGCVVPASRLTPDTPIGACYFRSYMDQSLRRVPELDMADKWALSGMSATACTVGWVCEARPQGFLAPAGLIPGERGQFIPDETVEVTVRVPPEFVRECHRVQMSPEEVLRSFAGDLAGIHNLVACPRADGYGSNGSDERDKAEEWLDRAHGMKRIDLDAVEAREEEEEQERYKCEEFGELLRDFIDNGGKADDLFSAVQALVDKQAQGNP